MEFLTFLTNSLVRLTFLTLVRQKKESFKLAESLFKDLSSKEEI